MARIFKFVSDSGCELHTINDPEDKLPIPLPMQVISIELNRMLVQAVVSAPKGPSAPILYVIRVREVSATIGQQLPN